MEIQELKNKFKSYKKEDIIITKHAELQAFVRNMELEEIKENIINPVKLVYAKKQEAKYKDEEKYDCYFAYSKHLYHRYALTINAKIIIQKMLDIFCLQKTHKPCTLVPGKLIRVFLIVTIIKINRDWQKAIG